MHRSIEGRASYPFSHSCYLTVAILSLAAASLLLSGCALQETAQPAVETVVTSIQGRVMGGQQPVVGSHLYLFTANTTGYGGNGIAASTANASISLLSVGVLTHNPANSGIDANSNYYVTTDANGSFSISSDYSCTAGTKQGGGAVVLSGAEPVYLYAVGGNPGAGVNSAAGFLASLGPCNLLTSGTSVQINEVTTIAMAYATAGFATDATHISSSGSALAVTNLANAFANSKNLVNLSTGKALYTTPGGNGSAPGDEIYTLANILAVCVNSTGPSSPQCSALRGAATSNGTASGANPTDTATAAINIAHYPAANIAALFALPNGTYAFSSGLTTQPNDFTISISYTGGGLYLPAAIAIDASGDVWITNNGDNSVTKLSSSGTALSPDGGGYTDGGDLDIPAAIAVDASGNVWITNEGASNGIAKLSSSGTGPYFPNIAGISTPDAIAIDASGNAWISSFNTSVTKLSSSGATVSPAGGYISGGILSPTAIAIDASGNAWIANSNSSVTQLSNSGTAISPSSGYTGGGLSSPQAIAINGSGNVWIANHGNNSVTELTNSGAAVSLSSGYTGGGLSGPIAIAIDGSNNVWVANYGNSTTTELSSSGLAISPSTGYPSGPAPDGIAIDGSGDVWVSDGYYNYILELIGAATPVVTPLPANLISPYTHPASTP